MKIPFISALLYLLYGTASSTVAPFAYSSSSHQKASLPRPRRSTYLESQHARHEGQRYLPYQSEHPTAPHQRRSRRIREAMTSLPQHNATSPSSTTSTSPETVHHHRYTQDQDLKTSARCKLQALLDVLYKCDKYIEVSQVNKKLQGWKNHEAFVLALAEYYKLSADSLSYRDLNALPGIKTALVYKAIAQLTYPIQWEQALVPNPDNLSEIGYDGWTMKHAVGRPLLEVRLALIARIQTLLTQNNLGDIPGLAEEIFNWISQDPTLGGEPSSSILYGSWEWMMLWYGIDSLIEEGYDPAKYSTDELLIMGGAILSAANKGALAQGETSPPPLSNITTPAFTQEPSHEAYTVSLGTQRPILTSSPSVSTPRTVTPTPTRAQESLNETCIPHAASQDHPHMLRAPEARSDVLSLLLMAHASDYIDLRTMDPCDEEAMNTLTAYAYLIRRFPKDPLIIKKIMAVNSLALPTRTDVAKETFQALGIDPSPEMIERYMKEDNLNWYEDHEEEASHTSSPNASSTAVPLPTGRPAPRTSKIKPRKLDKEARHQLKTQSLVDIFNKKFDQIVKALSEQTAEIINKISIVQYGKDHDINMDNASITITTVQREIISLDKMEAIVKSQPYIGMSADLAKSSTEEILESRGYFVTIQPQTSEHTSETEHRFFVRRDDLVEIHLPKDITIQTWCRTHDELVFGSSYKENSSGEIQAGYAINKVISGTLKDIESKIKNALIDKLKLARKEAYQPSTKEKIKETVLDLLIPWHSTFSAIWDGEPLSRILDNAVMDTFQILPTLFMGVGAGVQIQRTITKVLLSEATSLSERGFMEFLRRTSTRLAWYHVAEFRAAVGRVAERFVEDTLWAPLGIWRTLRAGRMLVRGGVRQLRQRLLTTHPQLAQKLSTLSKATEHPIMQGTWHLSDVATTSTHPYVKAINHEGGAQLLERIGSNEFVALNPQNLVPDKNLVVLTSEGELATTFTEVLQHYGLKSDKDAVILAHIARQQEKPSHIFEVGLRNYAKVEIGEKNYVYVEVKPYGPSKSATYWRLYDPKIRQPEILPSIVWNEELGKWRPTNPHLIGGVNLLNTLKEIFGSKRLTNEYNELFTKWENWVEEGEVDSLDIGRRTARVEAIRKMGEVVQKKTDILDLCELRIGSLPPAFPPGCKQLILPANLLVDVDISSSALPKKLSHLAIIGDAQFPLFEHPGIRIPDLSKLVEHFSKLKGLKVSYVPITSFSFLAESPALESLDLSNNRISELPLEANRLQELKKLRKLDLSENQLSHVPEGLFSLPRRVEVNIERNPISHGTLQVLQQRVDTLGYQGPRFRVSVLETSHPQAGASHSQAGASHSQAEASHSQAGASHSQAEASHRQALSPEAGKFHKFLTRPDKELFAKWEKWVEEAGPDNLDTRLAREQVIIKMGEVLKKKTEALNFNEFRIGSLPPVLPPNCKVLILPAHLLVGVDVSSTLPKKLSHLVILGDGHSRRVANSVVRILDISKLLKSLSNVKLFRASHFPITSFSLLAESPALRVLDLSNNAIREFSFEANMSKELKELKTLDLSHNQLSQVPESLFSLPQGVEVNIEHNRLSYETIQALQRRVNTHGYRGPRFRFSIFEVTHPKAYQFQEAVAFWFLRSEQSKIAAKWKTVALSPRVEEIESFSKFLTLLSRSKANSPQFRQQIQIWLEELFNSPTLREKTFLRAYEGTQTCVDRAALVFSQMQEDRILDRVELGKYNKKLPELDKELRQIFRIEKLSEIAKKKVGTMNAVDEIEVFLALQVKLHQDLELEWVPKDMNFFNSSGLSEKELRDASVLVKQQENRDYSDWLVQSDVWLKLIEGIEPTLYKNTIGPLSERVTEDNIKTEVYAELEELKLKGNENAQLRENARLNIQKRITDEMKASTYRALTHRVLAKRNLLSLLDHQQWPESSSHVRHESR